MYHRCIPANDNLFSLPPLLEIFTNEDLSVSKAPWRRLAGLLQPASARKMHRAAGLIWQTVSQISKIRSSTPQR